MRRLYRTLVTAIGSVSLLAVAGCGPGGLAGDESSESSAPPPKQGLANIDPCAILKSSEVTKLGLRAPQPASGISSSPGCDYLGNPFGVALYTNKEETVESAERKPVWAEFNRINVNGRTAARGITSGATKARQCWTLFNSDNGTIQVQVSEKNPGDLDECAKSTEIAEMIEPRMPE